MNVIVNCKSFDCVNKSLLCVLKSREGCGANKNQFRMFVTIIASSLFEGKSRRSYEKKERKQKMRIGLRGESKRSCGPCERS